jgi:hypothetical protein
MAGAAIAALVVVGTAVSIYGQIQAGKAQKRLAFMNAQRLEAEAKLGLQAREANAKLDKKRFILASGANKAAGGSSGGSGFGAVFVADVAFFGADQLIRDFNAKVFAFSKTAQAQAARYEGEALRLNSINSSIATGFKGAAAAVAGYQGVQSQLGGGTNLNTPSGNQKMTFV